jgi:2-dehydropantoate 2-reductase
MRFIVVGAGGIGGAIAGRVAQAGGEVVVVARGANAAAIRQHGLRVATPERLMISWPAVAETADDLELTAGDVLFLCVKSQDSETLLGDLAARPVRADGGRGRISAGASLPIFCAQNGIANEAMALRYFANVHGVEVTLQATHLEPGRVTATGSPYTGVFEIGRYPAASDYVDRQVAAALTEAGIRTTVREDVMAWKRAKLLRNLRNALEAMCGPEGAEYSAAHTDAVRAITRGAMAEARACFAAAGMSLVEDEEFAANLAEQVSLPVDGQGRSGGSTWQSVTRGLGAVETDFLNGEVALLGRTFGVPTPMNERIQQRMARFIRAGEAAGSLNPAELLAS